MKPGIVRLSVSGLTKMSEAMMILEQVADYLKTQGIFFKKIDDKIGLFQHATVRQYSGASGLQKAWLAVSFNNGDELVQPAFGKDVPLEVRTRVHHIISEAITARVLENKENALSV